MAEQKKHRQPREKEVRYERPIISKFEWQEDICQVADWISSVYVPISQ